MALEMTGRGRAAFVCASPRPPSLPALFSEANIECGQWMDEEEVRELTTLEANIPSVIPHLSSQQA